MPQGAQQDLLVSSALPPYTVFLAMSLYDLTVRVHFQQGDTLHHTDFSSFLTSAWRKEEGIEVKYKKGKC